MITMAKVRGYRKPFENQDNIENVTAPKIIIKKRPPRRPKLTNGSQAAGVSQISECCETNSILQTSEENAFHDTERISQIVQIEQIVERTRQQISLLQLSQESFVSDKFDSTSLIQDESVSINLKKNNRRRKRRSRKKSNTGDQENVLQNNAEISEASTNENSNVEVEQTQKQKVKPKRFLRFSKKNHESIINKSNVSENFEQGGNISKEKRDLKDKRKREKKVFCEHLPVDVVKKILDAQEPEEPKIVEGTIRINPRCNQNAYVTLTNADQDILVIGLKARNRALEGDLVAVVINTPDKWFKLSEDTYQKTGTVVSILEKIHPRKAVGFLKKQDVFVFLQPRDCRIPLMKINPKSVPRHFYDNPELFKETLFLCNIVDWKKVAFAEGEIQEIIGAKGDLDVESNAILLEHNLILTPYEDELLQDLPPADYTLTEEDLANREDLRKNCIFTIDPATAVDLDDALSCIPLENGNFEIGVHISDVTHFLKAFSSLDCKVAERATTVYMVDNVYHMLPKQLCLLCSLLPGQDRLAFSVILEMTPTGDIVNYRFSKTVINSCCQMSYEQAQIMIDNESYDWNKNSSLKISGNYQPTDLSIIVRNLYKISLELKTKRYDNGALRIDQPKLCVILDKETKMPISYKLEERRESNSLIEEFMLLANMVVAKHLYETFPEVSLLRSHPEPLMRKLQKTRDLLTKFGVILDIESAGALYNSMLLYQPNSSSEDSNELDEIAMYRMMVINTLCAKSMMQAVYKCSSSIKSKADLKHYALNVEFYTHFTSPIRRYPDCVVHRLLEASMKNESMPPEWSSILCTKVAANCNLKKKVAKIAQQESNALYFTHMLDLQGFMNAMAIVIDVKERSADAMLCDTGLNVRLYFSDTDEQTVSEFSIDHDVPTVKLTWTELQIVQVINIFSILPVKITKHAQLFRLQGVILPPVKADED